EQPPDPDRRSAQDSDDRFGMAGDELEQHGVLLVDGTAGPTKRTVPPRSEASHQAATKRRIRPVNRMDTGVKLSDRRPGARNRLTGNAPARSRRTPGSWRPASVCSGSTATPGPHCCTSPGAAAAV